jgi:predicted enzyme related to lactoylglutathione lyase
MNIVKNLSMVILMQHDLEKAITFYKALGCTLRFSIPGQWAEFGLGNITIGLCPTESSTENRRTGLVFAVDDIQSFYEAHKDTIPFLHEPIIKMHGGMASIQDPHGNIIDLYQATPEKIKEALKKQPSERCCKGSEAGPCCCKA